MKNNKKTIVAFATTITLVLSICTSTTLANDNKKNMLVSKLNANAILFESPSVDSNTVSLLVHNDLVSVIDIENDWARIQSSKSIGYVQSEYIESASGDPETEFIESAIPTDDILTIVKAEDTTNTVAETVLDTTSDTIVNTDIQKSTDIMSGIVEFTNWSEAKNIFKIGVPAKVYDLKSGETYYVKSFSNGNHADVETITKEDTKIMKSTFGNVWSWDVRPVLVTINSRTMVASINGMPHGSDTNKSNDMNGQVCIHFKGSKTHNGNAKFTQLHQDIALEAYNLSK